MESYKLELLDTCTSDYFQGCSTSETVECLCIPVDNTTTPKELYGAITREWESCDIPRSDYLNDSNLFDDSIHEFLAPVTGEMDCSQSDFAAFIGATYATPYNDDDCFESCYSYFKLSIV